jgi:hypothetical protein
MKNVLFLIALADQLDMEGKFNEADVVDEDFEEFLKLLEEGELTFDYSYSGSARDPRTPYSNPGRGPLPAYGIPGPQ